MNMKEHDNSFLCPEPCKIKTCNEEIKLKTCNEFLSQYFYLVYLLIYLYYIWCTHIPQHNKPTQSQHSYQKLGCLRNLTILIH